MSDEKESNKTNEVLAKQLQESIPDSSNSNNTYMFPLTFVILKYWSKSISSRKC